MPGTDPSTRQAPEAIFESYVFTRAVDESVGLSNVRDVQFTQLTGPADYTGYTIGQGLCDDGYSYLTSIGFPFPFNGTTYTNFVANVNGFLALIDPSAPGFTPSTVLASSSLGTIYASSSSLNQTSVGGTNGSQINGSILPTFTSQATVLAPWFDDLRNIAQAPSQLQSSPYSWSSTKTSRITQGLEPPPAYLSSVAYGVRYFHDKRTPWGRRLIVRWTVSSNYTQPSSVLTFEVCLYESGKVEFRYGPRTSILNPTTLYAGATVGIFAPSGSNRWRDMSQGMGYRDSFRTPYVYGGYAYSSAYVDSVPVGNEDYPSTASYSINLTPYANWPGTGTKGCVLSFSPPVNGRKVLPRTRTRAQNSALNLPPIPRTGEDHTSTNLPMFDDRRSAPFAVAGSATVVSYPTTMQRFFGDSGLGVAERQDLFTGDFLVTGSFVKSVFDAYVGEQPQQYVEPYNEAARHEQDQLTLTSSFYATGSNVSYVSDGFSDPLKSKTQVRFSLPVNVNTSLPGGTSTIYYYNASSKAWEVPGNTTYTLANAGTTPPSPNPGAGGDWANPQVLTSFNSITEDARGFGPIGNIVSSGSHTPTTTGDQTSAVIGSLYDPTLEAANNGQSYPNSVRNNSLYSPTTSETFTIPITAPFLIEKAVFEIPLSAGAGWFNDQTQCFKPLNTTAFDFAGPALTIALHRQVQQAENAPTPAIRDTILTGTITHVYDNVSTVALKNYAPTDAIYQIRPVGFLAYAGPPGAVVTPNIGTAFTGTVTVQTEALSAVGPIVKYFQSFTNASSASNVSGVEALMTATPTLVMETAGNQTVRVASISPFGRGGTGFEPSGRSILGNEHVTLQGLTDQTGGTMPNPFNVGTLSTTQQAALTASGFQAKAIAAIPMVTHFPAPYLVMPGDQLILSISKMRPYVYDGVSGTLSGQHDVTLMAGAINVTLYGSMVAAGVEYHDSVNQPLGSDGAHEMIGSGPVLDQFEPAYRHEYSGSFSDNVMLGDMLQVTTVGNQLVFTQGTRIRELSKLNSRNVAPLTYDSYDTSFNPYEAFRLQPWWERCGNVRTSQFVDSDERFWDSMMPALDQCFAADGCGIFIAEPTVFGSPERINVNATSYTKLQVGMSIFDVGSLTSFGPIVNKNWTKAYPYEPRYSSAARQANIANSFVATYLVTFAGISAITPQPVAGLMFGPVASGEPLTTAPQFEFFADVNVSALNAYGYYTTGSMLTDDSARALYGFGDQNTCFLDQLYIPGSLLGTNHFASYRQREQAVALELTYANWCIAPLIRGWKYGVQSGLPLFNTAYWRQGKFGQFRDMLEQRLGGTFYTVTGSQQLAAAVSVQFIDPSTGRITDPQNTASSNLDFAATSSMPYVDGVSINRPAINTRTLNQSIVTFKQDGFGNVSM